MKYLPNILSVSRILVSIALFFLGGYPVLFTVLYLYCGISDVADGFIARRWNVQSKTGAKLDSAGDLFLYTLITFIFFTHTCLADNAWFIGAVLFVFMLKILNMLITKIRFREWNIIHTIGNKISGLIIYLMLPVYILFPFTTPVIAIVIALFAASATIEETLIIFNIKQYDPNRKTIFSQPARRHKNG